MAAVSLQQLQPQHYVKYDVFNPAVLPIVYNDLSGNLFLFVHMVSTSEMKTCVRDGEVFLIRV